VSGRRAFERKRGTDNIKSLDGDAGAAKLAELVRGDLGMAVQQLKRESGKGLFVGGVKLPLALAELGLIDEYEFVVHPRLAGHGPTLFAGLSKHVDLRLVSRLEFGSGAVAMRYEPRR
jgi:dihydrofolate reductase